MYVGVMVRLCDDIDSEMKKVKEFGITSCQLCNWDMSLYTDELADKTKAACEKYDISISSVWAGYSGPKIWDLVSGPLTLGLLPESYRSQRVEDLKRGSDFAEKLGVKNVITHVGFIPENPNEVAYNGMVCALREVAMYLKKKGQYFLFETGQETPVTMLRCFEDIGTDNLGVNLDPANLMMYGKANPVDALDVIGRYVMDVHAKDGGYPTCGRKLGHETALGQGKTDYPRFIAKLKEIGYNGPLTIEREISGEQQIADILTAKDILEKLIAQ